jgi:hypothetical protein
MFQSSHHDPTAVRPRCNLLSTSHDSRTVLIYGLGTDRVEDTASILILSSHLCLCFPSGHSPFGFPTKTLYAFLFSPTRATCLPISSPWLDNSNLAKSTSYEAPHYDFTIILYQIILILVLICGTFVSVFPFRFFSPKCPRGGGGRQMPDWPHPHTTLMYTRFYSC